MKRILCALVTLCLCLCLFCPAAAVAGFVDVEENSWFREAVEYTCKIGLFRGMTEDTFGPDISITRGMFVTVLGRFTGIADDPNAVPDFDDVKPGSYYTGYVKWAQEAGIVKGITPRTFEPERSISRQDMCVMLRRYSIHMGIELTETAQPIEFTDADKIGDYARESILALQLAGIVNGMGDRFAPQGTSTRAQAANVFMKLALLAQSQQGAHRLLDEQSGIVVEYELGCGISAQTTLTVSTDPDALAALGSSVDAPQTYVLSFYENDAPITVSEVTVKIPVGDQPGESTRIVRALDGDRAVPIECTMQNGYYVFTGSPGTTYITALNAWTKNY